MGTEASQIVPANLKLTIATAICLLVGGTMGLSALLDFWTAQAIRDHGVETTANITNVRASRNRGGTISYSIEMAWRDQSGSERRYGPTHISELYARWIRSNDASVVGQTTIEYLEENRWARPIIVVDSRERDFQDTFGLAAGGTLLAVGVLLGAVLVRRNRLVSRRAPAGAPGT